ncbi:MAG: hypothetical protein ABW051_06700 [Burkholderiaceae bacterium]
MKSVLAFARACASAALALALLPAAAQDITPGKYVHQEFSHVSQAAFDANGRGLVTRGSRDGRVDTIMRFTWRLEGGKLHQRDIAFTQDTRTWTPAPDTAIEIRNITPESFELNRMDGGWTKWTRER